MCRNCATELLHAVTLGQVWTAPAAGTLAQTGTTPGPEPGQRRGGMQIAQLRAFTFPTGDKPCNDLSRLQRSLLALALACGASAALPAIWCPRPWTPARCPSWARSGSNPTLQQQREGHKGRRCAGARPTTRTAARCHGLEAVSGGIAPDPRIDEECSGYADAAKKGVLPGDGRLLRRHRAPQPRTAGSTCRRSRHADAGGGPGAIRYLEERRAPTVKSTPLHKRPLQMAAFLLNAALYSVSPSFKCHRREAADSA